MKFLCFLFAFFCFTLCHAQQSEDVFVVKKVYKDSSLDSLLKIWITPGIDTLDENVYSFVENAEMKKVVDVMECDYCNFSSDGKGKVYFAAKSNQYPAILKFYKKDKDGKKILAGIRTFQTYLGTFSITGR